MTNVWAFVVLCAFVGMSLVSYDSGYDAGRQAAISERPPERRDVAYPIIILGSATAQLQLTSGPLDFIPLAIGGASFNVIPVSGYPTSMSIHSVVPELVSTPCGMFDRETFLKTPALWGDGACEAQKQQKGIETK